MSDVRNSRYEVAELPYRIAVLCYLWNTEAESERLLMLHRSKAPNSGRYSPIGGKVEITEGESPHECAIREIQEEAGLELPPEDVRLLGVVAEKGYEGEMHWLLFLFEANRPVAQDEITRYEFEEGRLEWVPIEDVEAKPIPHTDQEVLWPMVQDHRAGGFFMVDIDCRGDTLVSRTVDARLP
ncbi:MAG: NUDIX domain-containing protein [Phycisphaerales bacterium]|nr:NUDIX domain-containing protein [Phycisphaerales bacterium]